MIRNRLFFFLVLIPGFAFQSLAQRPVKHMVFRDVNLVPMTREVLLLHRDVLVSDGIIVSISEEGRRLTAPPGALVVNASGKYLLPGLCDLHIHTGFGDEQQLLLYLLNGVTCVLDLNGSPQALQWRKQINEGTLTGPTMYVAGSILDGDPKRADHVYVKDRDAALRIVQQQAEAGYDFVKPYSSLTPDAYYGILDAARAHHLRVVGHVPRAVGVAKVIEARQEAIAHAEELYRYFVDRSKAPPETRPDPSGIPTLARSMRENDVWLITTVSTLTNILQQATDLPSVLQRPEMVYLPASYRREAEIDTGYSNRPKEWLLQNQIMVPFVYQMVGELHQGQVKMLAGTDATNPLQVPGDSLHEELKELVELCRLTPYQALLTATRNPGVFLHRNAGTIEPGKIADLVLLDADPLRQIGNTRRISGLLTNGRWYDRKKLDHMDQQLREHLATE